MMKGMPQPDGAMFGKGRKARSFGPMIGGQQQLGGEFDPMMGGGGPNPMMLVDQAGLPRPAWSSLDANRAMKLPPLEVGNRNHVA